jgi:hypothetical protein
MYDVAARYSGSLATPGDLYWRSGYQSYIYIAQYTDMNFIILTWLAAETERAFWA